MSELVIASPRGVGGGEVGVEEGEEFLKNSEKMGKAGKKNRRKTVSASGDRMATLRRAKEKKKRPGGKRKEVQRGCVRNEKVVTIS